MKMENRRVRTFTFMESFAVAGVKRSRSSAEGLRTVLALAFAAVIAVVGVFETPLMWGLVIPLAIVAVATAFYYQRAIDWEGGDSRPMYLGMFLVLPSVGAIWSEGRNRPLSLRRSCPSPVASLRGSDCGGVNAPRARLRTDQAELRLDPERSRRVDPRSQDAGRVRSLGFSRYGAFSEVLVRQPDSMEITVGR